MFLQLCRFFFHLVFMTEEHPETFVSPNSRLGVWQNNPFPGYKESRFFSPIPVLYHLHFEEHFFNEFILHAMDFVDVILDLLLEDIFLFNRSEIESFRHNQIESMAV